MQTNRLFRIVCSTLLTALLIVGGKAIGQDALVAGPDLIEPAGPPVVVPQGAPASRFWLRTDYLLWWSKNGPLSAPLVTNGSAHDALPGALGQPHTEVLYGGNGIDFGVLSGLRLESGLWLNAGETLGVESGFFFVGGNSRPSRFSATRLDTR